MPRRSVPRKVSQREPTKYAVIGCTPQCTLGSEHLGDHFLTVHGWFEQAIPIRQLVARAKADLGVEISNTATYRHLSRHLREIQPEAESPIDIAGAKRGRGSDLDVLEEIIAAGWRNSGNWKPTIQDTLKAMDMKLRLTKGSVFDDLFATIDAAVEEDDLPPENPEAAEDPPEPVEG